MLPHLFLANFTRHSCALCLRQSVKGFSRMTWLYQVILLVHVCRKEVLTAAQQENTVWGISCNLTQKIVSLEKSHSTDSKRKSLIMCLRDHKGISSGSGSRARAITVNVLTVIELKLTTNLSLNTVQQRRSNIWHKYSDHIPIFISHTVSGHCILIPLPPPRKANGHLIQIYQ